jgi:hypothetical protein
MFDDAGLEEVLFLLEVHRLAHPGEGIVRLGGDRGKAKLGAAAVGDEVRIMFARVSVEPEKAVWHRVAAVSGFQHCRIS